MPRTGRLSCDNADHLCGTADDGTIGARKTVLSKKVRKLLQDDGVRLPDDAFRHLLFHIDRSTRRRIAAHRRFSKKRLQPNDILYLTLEAHETGQRDEAFWRAFLAAHFGRESADESIEGQAESAGRLLNAFGTRPVWTWKAVKADSQALRRWLVIHADQLQTLSFGNHRKYESKNPNNLWEVLWSFIAVDSAAALFGLPSDDDGDPFDTLYKRLKQLHRFGRTGRFDFLTLLTDLGLIDVMPRRCYLRGATGPLEGARRLWGKRPVAELDDLAASLAEKLGVSPHVIEDALCNWQKILEKLT